ncbi:MAG: helix-turn-helix transcriptional regulator [Promethearchaeota archaeon]
MWLSKFLDLKDDIKELAEEIKKNLFKNRENQKITPLEFTILEHIFNRGEIYGYDLIQSLNRHFAGTWEAKSGTIYPLLSKLAKIGFLKAEKRKSPIGPIKTIYSLTKAGEELLKYKVHKNFKDQIQFIENFLVNFSTIYIKSFPEDERDKQIEIIRKLVEDMFKRVIERIPLNLERKIKCPNCGIELDISDAVYCSSCGAPLYTNKKEGD